MSDIQFRLIRTRKLTTSTSISVSAERGVTVRAPFWVPKKIIENFVAEKTDWIKKQLISLESRKVIKNYTDGEKHFFFGQEYVLSIISKDGQNRSHVYLQEDKLVVCLAQGTPATLLSQKTKEALLYWYLEKGIEKITERVNDITLRMKVDYTKITLKKVSSIWGSCSPTNHLSFNRKLVMAPPEVVDYVVIHEAAHLTHRNHSQDFWDLVQKFDPDYREHRRWLRKNHHLLSL